MLARIIGVAMLTTGCGAAPAPSGPPFTSSATSSPEDDDLPADDDAASVTTDPDDDDTSAQTTSATTDGATDDGSTTADATTTGTVDCDAPPEANAAWIPDFVDEVVADMSVTIGVRSSPAQRTVTADYVAGRFEALGYVAERHAYPGGTNVFAELEATTVGDAPVLVVGAHYDTVPGSPGANDNATGVAMVLALSRHLREVPCRTRRMLFVAFDQEEIGLVGSDAFASFLVQEDVEVESVHTIDQMGWDGDGDRSIEVERADAGLFDFYDGPAGTLVPPVPLTPTNTGATDHVSFRAYGLPAVGLTEEFISGDTTPHYHLPSDTYGTVDMDFLVSTTVLANLAFVQWIDGS